MKHNNKQMKSIETQPRSIELAHHCEIDMLHKKLDKVLDDYYNKNAKVHTLD